MQRINFVGRKNSENKLKLSWDFVSSLLVGKARNFKCNFHVKSFIRFVLASVCLRECMCLFSHWKIIIQSEREPNFWRYDQKFFSSFCCCSVQCEKCEYKRRDGDNGLMQSGSQSLYSTCISEAPTRPVFITRLTLRKSIFHVISGHYSNWSGNKNKRTTMPEEEFIESKHLSRLEWKIYEVDKSLRGSSSSFRTLLRWWLFFKCIR